MRDSNINIKIIWINMKNSRTNALVKVPVDKVWLIHRDKKLTMLWSPTGEVECASLEHAKSKHSKVEISEVKC